MKQCQYIIDLNSAKEDLFSSTDFQADQANLVLAFAERTTLDTLKPYTELKQRFPNASIVISSASGQISNCKLVEERTLSSAVLY